MRTFLIVASAAVLSGCTSNTGILPAGPDTYTISKHVPNFLGGVTEAEKDALTEANGDQSGTLLFVAQPPLKSVVPSPKVAFICLLLLVSPSFICLSFVTIYLLMTGLWPNWW